MKKIFLLCVVLLINITLGFSASNDKNKQELVCKKSRVVIPKTLKIGSVVSHDFIFKNVSDTTIDILKCVRSCDCTDVKLSSRRIKPNEKLVISVLVNTIDKMEGKHKITTVLTTSGARKYYYLSVKFNLEK